jgi:SAM-dependent methyltransferase
MPQLPSPQTDLDSPARRDGDGAASGHTGRSVYTDGGYLAQNPTWHVEDSPWKAQQILRIIRRNRLAPRSVCEVGCGAGEILVQLKRRLPDECRFWGYDVSPQAHSLAATRQDERLHFRLGDLGEESSARFDLILVIDVLEHLEDYYGFLRKLRPRSEHKIFHVPLDLSAYTVLRGYPILKLRSRVGHIHYFTRDTALAALRETGYELVDWFYPPDKEPLSGKPLKQQLLALLRRGLYKLGPDFAVRLLGGRSLMVLAR